MRIFSSEVYGAGIGLRSSHVNEILHERPQVPWFEVLTDNYFGPGGPALKQLDAVRRCYPITMHSVGMSLGSVDPLDEKYLQKIKSLKERFEPAWISEHLCWTSVHGIQAHDLLPLPYTEETVAHVAERIIRVQDFFGERLLIENVSSYLSYNHSEMTEWEFVSEVAERADCYLLLDINNVYVSSVNHGFDADSYLSAMPRERICEIHLGGHEERQGFLLDSHSKSVTDSVWKLYENALTQFGPVPTLIEWDNELPSFQALHDEAKRAEELLSSITQEQSPPSCALLS